MTSYSYTAHADGGTHNTQYGGVDASTPTEVEAEAEAEAEAKVKAMYSYPVHVTLQINQMEEGRLLSETVMDRGRLC
ncbi:hypothetical protein [Pseudomonas sp. ANT_H12B]|uniref:hypothetical protein n=1 Tax=Pseudomonas sp. ANT_H12B TaxID=2597348 RepID=UPI0011F08692|nr:hypothetical protein [Pseudomonas sp. ANT_H12B]KAA0978352.1 hypothetical protein FQ185_04420 [Pseudomonas sp. ANT_H12B]